jgi:hypothetical protein
VEAGTKKQDKSVWKSKTVFIIAWGAILVAWIPVFLAFYPSIMAYDFHRQVGEAIRGFPYFNAHNPLIHTWLIWVAIQIGAVIGSYEIGMACYTLFQMLVLSAILAYSVQVLYRLCHKKWLLIIIVLFYGIFPYNSVFAVSATKDVLFGALFLLFLLLYVEASFFPKSKQQKIWLGIVWVLCGVLMVMFRNNAIYAVCAFIPFVLLIKRKKSLQMCLLCLVVILGGKLGLEGIQLAVGSQIRGSEAEKFSVVFQQIARVAYYHNTTLDTDTLQKINHYFPSEVWRNYNPPLADTVKETVAQFSFPTAWKGHTDEIFKFWGELGLSYPNEYIDAFLTLTSGYWFWDDNTFYQIYDQDEDIRSGALLTFSHSAQGDFEGIHPVSKLEKLEELLINIVSRNRFTRLPILSNLFKIAFYVWGLLFLSWLFIYTKQKEKLLIILLPLLYLGTLFLGPAALVRYAFPLMISLPLFIGLMLKAPDKSTPSKS